MKLNDILIQACEDGHIAIARYALDNGADVHGRALYLASMNGHVEIVKLLLEYGANVRACGDALYWARENGHAEVVKILKQYMEK